MIRINAILDLLLVIFEVPEVDVKEVRPPKLVVETVGVDGSTSYDIMSNYVLTCPLFHLLSL